MRKAKKTGKAVAVPAKRGGAVAARGPKAELARYVEEDRGREPVGSGNLISVRGKRFKLAGDEVPRPLPAVILDYSFENAWFDRPYDEESPSPPACFAVGKVEGELAPHESSPHPQADACAVCEKNKFGSAETGRGKACSNSRKLALLSADDLTAEGVAAAEPAYLRISPSALSGFRGYVKKLTNALQLPTFAAVTTLDFDEDADYPVVTFAFGEEVPDDKALLRALVAKREEVQDDLLAGYDTSGYTEPDDAPARGARKPKRGADARAPVKKGKRKF